MVNEQPVAATIVNSFAINVSNNIASDGLTRVMFKFTCTNSSINPLILQIPQSARCHFCIIHDH